MQFLIIHEVEDPTGGFKISMLFSPFKRVNSQFVFGQVLESHH